MLSEDRINRQHSLGKLTAYERIDLLFDKKSFVEIGGDIDDGVVTGYGYIHGKKAFVASQDFTFKGGTLGEKHADKICNVMDMALEEKCPFISINDSGGARINEGIVALNGYAKIFLRNTKASGVIPQIAVIMGPCAGGACYSPAICDFIFMVKNTSQMFITGPGVVKEVTGETTTINDLGGSDAHSIKSGCSHFVYDNDKECLEGVRQLLEYLPGTNVKVKNKNGYDKHFPSYVNDNFRRAYEMRTFINAIVDEDSFYEVSKDFARNIIVGFARFDNKPVGIVANNPGYFAGVIDIDASDKAARFVRFCDCNDIPLVTFVDTPGYMPGTSQEHNGIIRHGAKLLFAYCESSVPRVSVILRKAFGGAYIAMNSKGIGCDKVFAWPTSQIAVMGAEGAVDILYKKELKSSNNPGELREELINNYTKEFLNPKLALEKGYVDEIIEPKLTREKIVDYLKTSSSKKSLKEKHSNIPL